jgi:hypothetical protein
VDSVTKAATVGGDEFAASRLPELPNAGYQTTRERQLSDEIMTFVRDAERDRLYLVSMVCDGYDKFAKIARGAWRHLRVDDDLIKAVWGYLTLIAGPDPESQRTGLLQLKWMSPAEKAGLIKRNVKAIQHG